MIWANRFYSVTASVSIIISLLGPHAAAVTTNADVIVLQDFSSSSSHHMWEEMNDPVMGGRSTGTFSIQDGKGHFQGNVAVVPFLQAPGFIKAETKKGESWPNVSTCQGLQITLHSSVDYQGYRVSFGRNRPPDAFPYTYGYKADLKIPAPSDDNDGFVTVSLPFSQFTDKWDAATGDGIVTCEEDSQYCPDQATLQNLYSIAVWGEGVEGTVDLQLRTIAAYGCASTDIPTNTNALEQEEVHTNISHEDIDNDETSILLEDFSNVSNHWVTMNDPVMGGKSNSMLTIANGIARFEGEVNIVPFLGAPGFITMRAGGMFFGNAKFSDVSHCTGFKLVLRSSEPNYKGYRLSFGRIHLPHGRHASGYKAPAWENVPEEESFGSIVFPFSSFSSNWDEGTGDIKVECTEENPKYCPTKSDLSNLKTISIWGEGVEGNVMLEIKSIHAIGCNGEKRDSNRLGQITANMNLREIYGYNYAFIGIATILVVMFGLVALVFHFGYRHYSYQEIKV
eukprot:CAMPEP_0194261398 /NCGR_PEP_ID=MMETSP0158-20130606/46006_1 /TAXON_ID=33649 /ORGANISM="Thalassionema nitzschioides, Strain L26-B" /LENGTH=508 /DNA_ID=CAMNT_0039001519 /DNA_START=14 /DNA_END=1540 /DNA_ORIENTATION=+